MNRRPALHPSGPSATLTVLGVEAFLNAIPDTLAKLTASMTEYSNIRREQDFGGYE